MQPSNDSVDYYTSEAESSWCKGRFSCILLENDLREMKPIEVSIPSGLPLSPIRYIGNKLKYEKYKYDPESLPYRYNSFSFNYSVPYEGPLDLPNDYFYFDKEKHSLHEFGMYEKNQYDYSDIEYPIPFHILYHDKRTHYKAFGKAHSYLPPFVQTGEIEKAPDAKSVLLITGASNNHFIVSLSCLLSLALADSTASIAYYDLGLSSSAICELGSFFVQIRRFHQRHNTHPKLFYRAFNFSSFPQWMDIANPADLGGYSWKMIGLVEMAAEWQAITGWVDAGSLLVQGDWREIKAATEEGVYSPSSLGDLQFWVHPKTIEFLEGTKIARDIRGNQRMCSGGHVFLDFANVTTRYGLLVPYYQCAFTERCVTPRGTTRNTHRQDQAVLSVLVAEMGLRLSANPQTDFIAQIHTDNGVSPFRIKKKVDKLMRQFEISSSVCCEILGEQTRVQTIKRETPLIASPIEPAISESPSHSVCYRFEHERCNCSPYLQNTGCPDLIKTQK